MSYNSPFTGNVIQPTDVSFNAITLTENTQLFWPFDGNGTETYAARIMEVSASSAGLELWMPPANQGSVGQDALIRNVGSYSFTVKDYAGTNTIITIGTSETANSEYIYITDNGDEQGTWGRIAFGAGTASVDAATLAGYGLVAQNTTLNQSSPVTTTSSNATLTSADRGGLLVWTGGAGTLTLDDASTLGNNWFTQIRNSGTGLLTIACSSGSDTFNSSATVGLQPSDSCFIACSGNAFYSVGLGRNTQFNFSLLVKTVSGAGSGQYILTPSEASNVIQKYISSGPLTGNVTIIVPPTIQVYYIENATTNGATAYTVTITTNTGGSTASLTPGQQATLICDSQNILNANNVTAGSASYSLPNGSVGSPSLYFASETNTGVYRATSGSFDITVLGTNQFSLTSSGATIPSGIGGGTF
jgi:hypothetical protein